MGEVANVFRANFMSSPAVIFTVPDSFDDMNWLTIDLLPVACFLAFEKSNSIFFSFNSLTRISFN